MNHPHNAFVFKPPGRYRGLHPRQFFLDLAPIVSVEDVERPHHFEAFLNHEKFPKDRNGMPSYTRVLTKCKELGQTAWFDWICANLAIERLHNDPSILLSINVQPQSLVEDGFTENLTAMLRDNIGVMGRMTVELTENHVGVDSKEVVRFGSDVREVDAAFVLDDVCEGDHDMHMINKQVLALSNGIKFSGSSIKRYAQIKPRGARNKKKLATRQGMIRLANNMHSNGKTVTLEGIHSLDTVDEWRGHGLHIDYAQLARGCELRQQVDGWRPGLH